MLIFLKSWLPVLVMISSMSVPTVYMQLFYVRRANSGRRTLFKRKRCPFFAPLFVGTLFTQWHEILSHNIRDFKLS